MKDLARVDGAVAGRLRAGHCGSRAVDVDDVDFRCVSVGPPEHDSPLVTRTNRVQAPQVTPQNLQRTARRDKRTLDAGINVKHQAQDLTPSNRASNRCLRGFPPSNSPRRF